MTKESSHSRAIFFNMYFEVLSEIRFRKHPSQSSLYFNGAEYFYRQSWSSNYLFLRVCVLYVLYDSWVSTDLSVSIKTTTTISGGTLAKVRACYLTASSHYMNQCWLILSKVQWHSSEGIIRSEVKCNKNENYIFEIPSRFPRDQWVKLN